MKYTQEITDKLINDYVHQNVPVEDLAIQLNIPKRSVIAKLSSLGVYKRKAYIDKTGKVPIKKSEYIDSIARSLKLTVDELDSLEKVNKRILQILDQRLKQSDPKLEKLL